MGFPVPFPACVERCGVERETVPPGRDRRRPIKERQRWERLVRSSDITPNEHRARYLTGAERPSRCGSVLAHGERRARRRQGRSLRSHRPRRRAAPVLDLACARRCELGSGTAWGGPLDHPTGGHIGRWAFHVSLEDRAQEPGSIPSAFTLMLILDRTPDAPHAEAGPLRVPQGRVCGCASGHADSVAATRASPN